MNFYLDDTTNRFFMRVALGIVDRAHMDRRGSNTELCADATDYLQTDFALLTRDVLRNQVLGSRLNGRGKKFLNRKSNGKATAVMIAYAINTNDIRNG